MVEANNKINKLRTDKTRNQLIKSKGKRFLLLNF